VAPVSLSDEEFAAVCAAAEAAPYAMRGEFLRRVAAELGTHRPEETMVEGRRYFSYSASVTEARNAGRPSGARKGLTRAVLRRGFLARGNSSVRRDLAYGRAYVWSV
jgi:hypothetical protein